MDDMIRVKKVGRIDPMTKHEYFRTRQEEWERLKAGQIIEVPIDLFPMLSGVTEAEGDNPPIVNVMEEDKGVANG